MTDLIPWKEEYSVGVEETDNQHKELFKMLNILLDSINNDNDRKSIDKVLEDMVNYVDFHFKSEETYTARLPNFTAHRLEHWEFVKQTMDYQKRFSNNKDVTAQEIFNFLFNWLKKHIIETDINDFRYLREHGLL